MVRGLHARVKLCRFKRCDVNCNNPVAMNSELCEYHTNGGCLINENTFYSVRLDQFLSTLTAVPEPGDLKGDRLDDISVCCGQKEPSGKRSRFRKCCAVCWSLRRSPSKYCVRHTSSSGRSSSDSQVACKFFDMLSEQMSVQIIHRHIRPDGAPVGEELKLFNRADKRTYWVDGFVADEKLVIEFLGDFFHGNPAKFRPWNMNASRKTTFRVLYDETYARHKVIAEMGYTVYYVWENDFRQHLKNPTGGDVSALMRRWDDWATLPPDPPSLPAVVAVEAVSSEPDEADEVEPQPEKKFKLYRPKPPEILGWIEPFCPTEP